MESQHTSPSIPPLPSPNSDGGTRIPLITTWIAWLAWMASLVVLAVHVWRGHAWEIGGLITVDGFTTVMWVAVTFFSAIVHSFSRRYMAGNRHIDRFFGLLSTFTLVVGLLIAADHLVLFAGAWLAMGLVMAELISHVRGWPRARAAASYARRYFLASAALLAGAVLLLWWTTGASTLGGLAAAADGLSRTVTWSAAGLLVLTAMLQSALVPFHTWLLSSMTAPTPASALMHAGFVNAGGLLLTRLAPVVTADQAIMWVVVVAGATSALAGKLLKSVRADIKSKLGCSTVGQMGFMVMQAGFGFFAAAITHLILHGFYKAYLFLGSGGSVERQPPVPEETDGESFRPARLLGAALVAAAGGGLFVLLTGKGTSLDGGLVLAVLVVLTSWRAAREAIEQTALPRSVRYGAVPAAFLVAIALYAGTYNAVAGLLTGLPAVPNAIDPTLGHLGVGLAFLAVYLVVETGIYKKSRRLYAAVLNAGQPAPQTLTTSTETYHEY